jgi:pimeloyl-ACP methyl ester carboxylesterase
MRNSCREQHRFQASNATTIIRQIEKHHEGCFSVPKFQSDSFMKRKLNGIELNVRDEGQGEPTLLFLHYWGGSSRTWGPVISDLRTDFRCVAYDHRGWGDSDKPETGYSIECLAKDAEALIQALGLCRYVLIGHSMGGKVAQRLAAKRPEGLEALILVAPAPPTPMAVPEDVRKQMIQAYQNPEAVQFLIQNVLTSVSLPEQIREQIIEDTLKGGLAAKHAWPEKGMLEDISSAVPNISVPTLVLAGENDQIEKIESLERALVPNIPTARMTIIPETGHLSPLEVPDQIASEIRAFLGS